MIKQRGLFISVEGIDGAGKSTHVSFIQQFLENKGKKVVITREPGGTELGEKIRNLLLNSKQMHKITELLLMFASRQELINSVIMPSLTEGVCVVADRFLDASIAYQGYGRKIGADKLNQVMGLLEPQLQTNLTFLFNAPLSLAMNRITRSKEKDRIENENSNFFTDVQNAYLNIAQQDPQRVKLIATNQPVEKTRFLIASHLDQLFREYDQ